MFLKKIFFFFLKSFSFSKNAPLIESGCKGTTFFSFHQMFLKKIFNHLAFQRTAPLSKAGAKVIPFPLSTKYFYNFFFNYFVIC